MVRANSRFRVRPEHLENRLMLAGDVTAEVVGNTLEIRGDDEANEIVIMTALDENAEPIAGSFVVVGLNGTTINGEAEVDPFEGARHLDVRLGEGDDVVQLTFAAVAGDVDIRTNAGLDQVWLGQFPGQSIDEGPIPLLEVPDAFLELDPPVFDGPLGTVHVRGDLSVSTGADDDVIAVSDVTVRGNATLETGGGDDQVFILAMNDFMDEAEEAVASALAIDLAEALEADPDRGLNVRGRLEVNTGGGDDSLTAFHVHARRGFFINDPQNDTDIQLSDVDGGLRGVVINGPFGGGGPFGDFFDRIRDFFDGLFGGFPGNGNGNGNGGLFGGFGRGSGFFR
jgi:hypothetical protein